MSRMRRILGLMAGLAVVLALAYHPAAKAQVQGLKWEKAAPFPEPEEELYGTSVNGKMYVFGGFGPGGHPVGMAWEYDPNGDKWTKKKTMPIPSHHSAVAAYTTRSISSADSRSTPTPMAVPMDGSRPPMPGNMIRPLTIGKQSLPCQLVADRPLPFPSAMKFTSSAAQP